MTSTSKKSGQRKSQGLSEPIEIEIPTRERLAGQVLAKHHLGEGPGGLVTHTVALSTDFQFPKRGRVDQDRLLSGSVIAGFAPTIISVIEDTRQCPTMPDRDHDRLGVGCGTWQIDRGYRRFRVDVQNLIDPAGECFDVHIFRNKSIRHFRGDLERRIEFPMIAVPTCGVKTLGIQKHVVEMRVDPDRTTKRILLRAIFVDIRRVHLAIDHGVQRCGALAFAQIDDLSADVLEPFQNILIQATDESGKTTFLRTSLQVANNNDRTASPLQAANEFAGKWFRRELYDFS